MGVNYNARYTDVSQIKGPSGWYWINTPIGPVHTYVNQEYDGGGWVLVIANTSGTAGMRNLTYQEAISSCNIRTHAGINSFGTKLGALSNYNFWVGLNYWPYLSKRVTSNKITLVQYIAGPSGVSLDGTHNFRSRWTFDNFSSSYAFSGYGGIVNEIGGAAPGLYSYHAANQFSLTTYDMDQDAYGSNCSSSYGNNPWWYGACWSGSYFGYDNGPYWESSSTLYTYGAIYIK